jgi:hypothetical protein
LDRVVVFLDFGDEFFGLHFPAAFYPGMIHTPVRALVDEFDTGHFI